MEVDSSPTSSSPVPSGNGTLKRSNSAPMINSLITSQADSSPPTALKPANAAAARRLSSSNMSLNSTPAPASPPIRGTDRVARIKQEEIHIADRERQHEREIQSSLWISNNWEHLSFDSSEPMEGQHRRPRSFSESLHIMTQSNILCGSPSPTRGPVKIPVKNNTFTPSPSPSPTRKNFLRSLSPIAVRTGPLKRKLDSDGGDRWEYISPPKKFNTGPATPDRIMTCSHPLANSPDQLAGPASQPVRGGRQHHSSAPGLVQHHFYHHQHQHHSGGASPLLGGAGSLVKSSLCTSSGLGPSSSHSPLSSSSTSSGGGGHSPHAPVIVASGGGGAGSTGGSQIPALGPVMLSTKQAFLFQPVSEGLSSPSSTSSSSSPSSSSTSMTLHHHMQHQQAVHDHHHYQSQQQQQQHLLQEQEHQHHHVHHQALAEMNSDDAASRGSNNDVYMTDSEMGENHSAEKLPGGFNFKPISPDHP
ncbi:protein fam122a [Plakobranchus ocellatus]|uniref:Protein fam122a n=1 Tax=Plakobranchus ocellatus TaxID=259542 RepID=A0AAV4DMW1_9GAST|nr:protein fam122a [Plakobranchus ocellatus]